MNICILSYGRTGGTTFCRWLSKELDKKYIHEPFNKNHMREYEDNDLYNNDYSIDENNYVIKLQPEELYNIKGKKITIGLIRENTKDCAISHLNSIETNNWHRPYFITNDWINSNKNKINKLSEKILEENDRILNMKYDIVLTYEGLFINKLDIPKICEFLNIINPKYINYMNVMQKYRKTEPYKKPFI
jgi:hypothetical protein